MKPGISIRARQVVTSGLTAVEDVVYVGLGIVLSAATLSLLFFAFRSFILALVAHTLPAQIIDLLDQILLVLLMVELLYTIQVSFREHALVPEPFLIVALIATVRKILVLTAQIFQASDVSGIPFRHSIAELGLLSLMVLILVGALILLRRRPRAPDSIPPGV